MPHHAKAALWTEEPTRYWLKRCDQCSKRRLVADYYEVYPPLHSKGDAAGWWFACRRCLLSIINEHFDDALKRLDDMLTLLEAEAQGGEEARRQSRPDDLT